MAGDLVVGALVRDGTAASGTAAELRSCWPVSRTARTAVGHIGAADSPIGAAVQRDSSVDGLHVSKVPQRNMLWNQHALLTLVVESRVPICHPGMQIDLHYSLGIVAHLYLAEVPVVVDAEVDVVAVRGKTARPQATASVVWLQDVRQILEVRGVVHMLWCVLCS